MAYIPGEEEIESAGEDDALMSAVYSDLKKLGDRLGTRKGLLYGSTRFGSHGYMSGFYEFPDISVLQVKYPQIEFKTPDPSQEGFHTDDQFGDDSTVAWRLKGSKGWHLG